jgi:hypothetical protein
MWPLFSKNLELLGQKLEASLNQLALGHDVIVEDSNLMLDKISEIGRQLGRANHLMKQNDKYVSH